jgi:hypothetical protein
MCCYLIQNGYSYCNIIVRGRGLPAVLVVLEYYGGVKWKGPSLDPPGQASAVSACATVISTLSFIHS